MVKIGGIGGIVGGIVGGVGSLVGSSGDKKAAKQQARLLEQANKLQAELTTSRLEQAQQMFKDVYAENIISQSGSGFSVDSASFQGVRNRVTREYLKDVQRIETEGKLASLGIESQIAGIKASAPNTLQSTLGFLTGTAQGIASGYSLFNIFKT